MTEAEKIAAVRRYLTQHEQTSPLGREQWNADIRAILDADD